ncbi:MAG: glycosyltransferase family 4 protein [Anaerolineae bacterium]|nr:glycosyltransferase family 4 protein [Anaerolineae bacterium]
MTPASKVESDPHLLSTADGASELADPAVALPPDKEQVEHPAEAIPPRRLRVGMWTPLPPAPSGISDYAVALIQALAQFIDITVYTIPTADTSLFQGLPVEVRSYTDYRRDARAIDAHVYHMGNSAHYHTEIHDQLLREPGITVLHDLALFGFYLYNLFYLGSRQQFYDEVSYQHGGAMVRQAGKYISGELNTWLDIPMNRRVVESSQSTIVHTQYGKDQLKQRFPQADVHHIMHGARVLDDSAGADLRMKLGWRHDQLVIGVFGEISPHKRVHVLLEVLPKLLKQYPNARLIVAGRDGPNNAYPQRIRQMLRSRAIRDVVHYADQVPTPLLEQYIQAVDIAVNLRSPTTGEMSGILLRALGAGKLVICSDVPQLAELPGSFVWKVPVDDRESSTLLDMLINAARNQDMLRRNGAAARQFIAANATWELVAQRYLAVIEAVVQRSRK